MYNGDSSAAKRAKIEKYDDGPDTLLKAQKREERAAKQKEAQAAMQAALAKQSSYVCVLCPDTTRDTLVKLADAPTPQAAKDPRRRAGYAHKVCVMFTPSTWIARDDNDEERVYGFENIEKARWTLVRFFGLDIGFGA
jgi:hypothetical protein